MDVCFENITRPTPHIYTLKIVAYRARIIGFSMCLPRQTLEVALEAGSLSTHDIANHKADGQWLE